MLLSPSAEKIGIRPGHPGRPVEISRGDSAALGVGVYEAAQILRELQTAVLGKEALDRVGETLFDPGSKHQPELFVRLGNDRLHSFERLHGSPQFQALDGFSGPANRHQSHRQKIALLDVGAGTQKRHDLLPLASQFVKRVSGCSREEFVLADIFKCHLACTRKGQNLGGFATTPDFGLPF
ncbi:MAG TPA: hypothetical protein VNY24_00535 [Candidatus Acidoferrales bacterium]|jgi:hypothetical protein|nr:hypothetical protein [Candidatus Acidoferrales bacterium]